MRKGNIKYEFLLNKPQLILDLQVMSMMQLAKQKCEEHNYQKPYDNPQSLAGSIRFAIKDCTDEQKNSFKKERVYHTNKPRQS